MKVVLATPNFHQPRGNTVTVQRIADHLNRAGIETEIISVTDDSSLQSLPEADVVHGFHAYRFYKFMQKLKQKPSVYMITITGTDLNHFIYDPETRDDVLASLNGASAVHVFNDEAKETLLKEAPSLKDKTYLIPQGADDFISSPFQIDKEENTFLFVLPAGIRKVKNVPSAISMLKKGHDKDSRIRLWITGPVLEEEEGALVQKMAEENKDWVTYLGEIPHKDMGAIYKQADAVLNTSHSEGQSSAILEAMAHELPVLVSGNQGNRSIVANGETGFVYDNADEFLDYVKQIMNNNELRQTIGKYAKAYIAENHSSQHEAEQLRKIYEEVGSR
ncbi:glycosyltransferase [Sediminibacillus massiliensis]|uniref:glycosyltransferase n=1 Tax=Sediminibacillus massiliensis TaxID=1926277 RepID=UPI0015C2D51B|nr:glycosyltransferase [Sediminibacillus massiliensis]